ncbi:MAG: PD-(D/E)XK nuclease family protein, partial [Longicatena sp.]
PAIIESKEVYSDWSSEDTINAFNKSHQLSGWTLLPEDTLDYNASHIKNIRLNKNGLSFTLYDETSIEECLKELYKLLVEQLTDGCIEVNPVKNACTYCMYKTICRFKGQEKDPEVLVLADTSLKKGSGKDEVE